MSGYRVQFWTPSTRRESCRGSLGWPGLENMWYKEMLEELGFFSLEKRGLRRDAIATGRIESCLPEALGHKAQLQSSPAGL